MFSEIRGKLSAGGSSFVAARLVRTRSQICARGLVDGLLLVCLLTRVIAQTPSELTTGLPASGTSAVNSAEADKSTSNMPLIGVGDLIRVSVFGAPESDQEMRVSADGKASLNFIGVVKIAGLSTEAAQQLIARELKAGGYFADPQVTVFVKEYATQGVSVLGEVQKPGVYPVLGSRRLFDVLSLAGGTTARAGKVVSVTHRDHPQTPVLVPLENSPTPSGQNNVEILPGDTVLVSKAGLVYVVGDVQKPSGVVMENGSLTVLQALAVAEGPKSTASLNKARLIRKTSDGHQDIPLQLKEMLSAKTPDVQLQAEDIIFVPGSAAKSASRRSLEAIVQTATGLAIYRR
jgi:polysaccharide export outer membrane protein